MSSSTYAFSGDPFNQAHSTAAQDTQFLNPFSPSALGGRSDSPALHTHTPAESVSSLSVHYQSSELSEVDDTWFGFEFGPFEPASPSFLNDSNLQQQQQQLQQQHQQQQQQQQQQQAVAHQPQHAQQPTAYLPLSPDQSPPLPEQSPNATLREGSAAHGVFPDLGRTSVAPQELSLANPPSPAPFSRRAGNTNIQLTPNTDRSPRSSDDGPAPPLAATMQSPRVTVSHWDSENGGLSDPTEQTLRPAARDASGRWIPDPTTGQAGLAPAARISTEVQSINDLEKQRKLEEKNQEVDAWLKKSATPEPSLQAGDRPVEVPPDVDENSIPNREITLGDQTENKIVSGQTYLNESDGGGITRDDLELLRQGRNWEDAPVPWSISGPDAAKYQPETSQAAIERFENQCRDTDTVSRRATWGTRRLSLPSIHDYDTHVTGIFKKLTISRGDTGRRPSLIQGIRGLVRKTSTSKRKGPAQDDASFTTESSTERKEASSKLAPPSPKPSWPRKLSVPNINTAFIHAGSTVASIGVTHARTSSISAATPITSPKSPGTLNLSVKKPLNRLRSKSETSGIVDLWRKTGGPPVSNLGNTKTSVTPEPAAGGAVLGDEDDDDDELYEDGDLAKDESTSLIDDITPNLAGFQQHIVKLNPMLANVNQYLVERIAYQQLHRYKGLLKQRLTHLQAVKAGNCACGSLCIASGGSANPLDSKGEPRGVDPLSAGYAGSDGGDITPLEGAINQDSFPQDIPMPPTATLPAEFECQLCFTAKKFQKPSDWTKHVHEDVQPFTCTWERCKEPKMFKRKADWVRHENEGHRHLEWWTCDVDDCRHRCYRRDNFLQHLVREHKFVEPKIKTKAAIKRAGGLDPTWAKVEQCHQETSELPQNEPCRFCGKTFPTWKKLTVHLAKHMEHISLPVLRLVAKKELEEDTVISPVQEPPPRQFPITMPSKPDHPQQQHPHLHHVPFVPSSGPVPQGRIARQAGPMLSYTPHAAPPPLPMYHPIAPPSAGYSTGVYSPGFDDLAHNMAQAHINNMSPINPGSHQFPPHHPIHAQAFQSLNSQAAFSGLPVTSAAAAAAATTGPATPYIPSPPQTAVGGTPGAPGFMAMSSATTTPATELEPFPALSIDALGLSMPPDTTGAVVAAAQFQVQQQQQQQQQQHHQQQQHQQQFSPQGSVSPYAHSPNVPQTGFY